MRDVSALKSLKKKETGIEESFSSLIHGTITCVVVILMMVVMLCNARGRCNANERDMYPTLISP